MQWSHVYVPVVPATLLDLVEAPVPFILGIHTDWLGLVSPDCLRDVVIVDVDTRTVDYGHRYVCYVVHVYMLYCGVSIYV